VLAGWLLAVYLLLRGAEGAGLAARGGRRGAGI
jgi:hypothetical protein